MKEETEVKELIKQLENEINNLKKRVNKLENKVSDTNSDISRYNLSKEVDEYVSTIWPK